MATSKQVKAWISQAESDLEAAKAEGNGVSECHRRYWIQQSYEKAIKALALMKWTGTEDDDREFTRRFLLQHSPLKHIGVTPSTLSKRLRSLAHQLEAQIRRLDNAGILLKIDATTPTSDPSEVSYRYPFLADGDYTPPAEFAGWDAYQGNFQGVESAVRRFVNVVKAELKLFARMPK